MSELRLDYQHTSPFPWTGVALLILVMFVLVLTGTYYQKLNTQALVWESKAERMLSKTGVYAGNERLTEQATTELAQEVTNANAVIRQLSVPWEALFAAIESSAGAKVTLLALEPDVEKLQVKISGETKDYKTLMNYITKLQGYTIMASVFMQNHHVQLEDPDKPVRFLLLATWRDAP